MANWTQEDGATKPLTNTAEVSAAAQISGRDVTGRPGGDVAAVPCLIPSFADAVKLLDSRYSCLVLDTPRKHIALPPVYLCKKRTGIQEELNADLLKYSTSLNGVPLAYDNIKVVGQYGDIYDDQGFIHVNIEASFVIFRPKKGSKLVGVINKIGVSHVGCLVHGCFNASVVKPSLLTPEQWRDSGLCVGGSLEFEVFQLDADVAGVLLIRGRLERSRVQELVAQTEQNEALVETAKEPTTESESTEGTTDNPKPKKKKKKDKHEKESAVEESINGSNLQETYENHETTVDTMEVDSNSNGHHKEKKKKKKHKRKESDERLPFDLPGGYVSDKTSKKRRAPESEETLQVDSDTPVAKKKKKKNK
ncbi:DNA-directed RNA polymerase I subunit RPA43-like [Myxocyprinus asiaticus]|uniref:DNA-directed RNA polymerase I subunit RPA43-like n=1 Tax=Myxocyprinus asiaticus TaxID=70543 RepID=UPI002223069B|nr:DNA-directed RNA polymerase I subunit RPA43-like [Myxocyprinus asiaticus]